jgi:hypothetical protein
VPSCRRRGTCGGWRQGHSGMRSRVISRAHARMTGPKSSIAPAPASSTPAKTGPQQSLPIAPAPASSTPAAVHSTVCARASMFKQCCGWDTAGSQSVLGGVAVLFGHGWLKGSVAVSWREPAHALTCLSQCRGESLHNLRHVESQLENDCETLSRVPGGTHQGPRPSSARGPCGKEE